MCVFVRKCVYVCVLWHLLSPSCCCHFFLKLTLFDIIGVKWRGLSFYIFVAGSAASCVAFPLTELNTTIQLHTSKCWVSNMCSTVGLVRGTTSYCCLNLCLTRLYIFLTNHDYCHNLPLQPTFFYPLTHQWQPPFICRYAAPHPQCIYKAWNELSNYYQSC